MTRPTHDGLQAAPPEPRSDEPDEVVEFVTLDGDVVAGYDGPFEGMIPALNETMRTLGCVLVWRFAESVTVDE